MSDQTTRVCPVPAAKLVLIASYGSEASQNEVESMAVELAQARDLLASILKDQPFGHDATRASREPHCLCRWCKAHRIAMRRDL